MGIVRRVEWRLTVPAEQAAVLASDALRGLGMDPEVDGGRVRGKAARSLRRNRWAAEVSIDVTPVDRGSVAACTVDMGGNRHYALMSEIAEAMGDDVFHDRGAGDAVARLGKPGRLFGRKEIRHLRHLLRGTEQVLTLGQGTYEGKQGLVVLTNERLFFFEKSLGSETVEEFWLKSISSLEAGKKLGGERLIIHVSGNRSEIKQLFPGQAEELARQVRELTRQRDQQIARAAASGDDPMAQLERLARLRDQGVIDATEFDAKKAELLKRI